MDTPDTVASASPHATHVRGEGSAHVNVNRIEISERVLSILALVMGVAAFCLSFWAIHESDRAAREAKQLQIQVMDHNALLLREGILKPSDETYGPAGNLQYVKPKSGR